MSILKYKMDPGVEVSCVLRRRSCGFGFGSKSVRVTLNLGISYDTLSLSLSLVERCTVLFSLSESITIA